MATIKQKLAMKELAVNGGNITGAMRKAGYAPSIVNDTNKLTKSKGWAELMNEYLPDKLLADKHLKLLNKKEVYIKKNGKKTEQPDTVAVSKALDMAYKIKNKYPKESSNNFFAEKIDISVNKTENIAEVKENNSL